MTKIQKIIKHLQDAHELQIDGTSIDEISVSSDAQNPDNEAVCLGWTDDQGLEYAVILTVKGLRCARIFEHELHCEDCEGDPCVITCYARIPFPFPSI